MIRPATEADLPSLVAMGERFIRETGYGTILQPDPAQMAITAKWLVESEGSEVFVADQAGTLIGMLGIACFTHPMTGQRTAGELFWWVEPEHRGSGLKLVRTAQQWAKAQGATRMHMVAPDERVATVYQRLGFRLVERNFDLEL